MKNRIILWTRRALMLGSGATLMQQGCAVDQAVVEDLATVAVRAFVNSLVGGVL